MPLISGTQHYVARQKSVMKEWRFEKGAASAAPHARHRKWGL
jgi:hypothetical protein